ncbi:hypothetical protein DRE_06780 [Drechslerella stenobrocha 248]|uniref:Nickel/cobalt efflux system n=1 Tax=Drechslerella stenobrocha 248 TaxID=1043628 RepID=W7HWS3_9PEZI|nr:hypothetical protein DRE_06780 [Drechslerella stenobrocha 248]
MPSPVTAAVKRARARVEDWHAAAPYLSKFPLAAIWIILLLVIINCLVWIAVGVTLHYEPALAGTAILSWTLGLRHALDADHICAIDLMTRRLLAAGQRPVTIGTWFSLGHSTIVIVTSIAVAATATAISGDFDRYSRIGGIIGTSVSTAFLVILAAMNVYILITLVLQLRRIQRAGPGTAGEDQVFRIQGGGFLFPLFKKMFKLIDRPWKMYPLGVLFGLGFDTSSEIALLGIASIQAVKGTPIWVILIFPALFTAGMCLIDTIDGALMMATYTSTSLAHDNVAVLYYSIVLSVVTCVVAVVIGVLQLLNLVLHVAEPTGPFWDGVGEAGDRYDIIGGAIVATFVVVGVLSLLLYKPWRRAYERKRARFTPVEDGVDAAGLDADEGPGAGSPKLLAGGHGDVVVDSKDVKVSETPVAKHDVENTLVVATSSRA